MFNRIGFLAFGVFFDAPDSGSGGGAPDGGADFSGGGDPNPPAEPTVYEVDDDTLIKPKGSDKPVKYGEHFRGFQSQFTKASQEAARLKRELQARDERLRQIEAQQQQAARQNQGPAQDPYGTLRQAPYLTGQDAADYFERLEGNFQTRDQISLALVKKVQQIERILGGLNESHTGQQFDSKINRWVQELGLPTEATDLAKEIYLAYEGDDLDNEFPTILRNRWEQMVRVINAQQQAKVAAARKQPFLPGRGGTGSPSRPLQLDPRMSASQIAEELFPLFAEDDRT
jgi:hypothetical protein